MAFGVGFEEARLPWPAHHGLIHPERGDRLAPKGASTPRMRMEGGAATLRRIDLQPVWPGGVGGGGGEDRDPVAIRMLGDRLPETPDDLGMGLEGDTATAGGIAAGQREGPITGAYIEREGWPTLEEEEESP